MYGSNVFWSENVDDICQEDDVEENDNDYRNGKEPVTISDIHPAVVIFIVLFVDDVREEEDTRKPPAKKA